MLKNSSLEKLRGKKNLLAFSAGVDSSALFFILLQNKIKFDIAIVNYNIREQSKEETQYAKELASKNIRCNALCPGFINTDMTESLDDRVKEHYYSQIPLKNVENN